MRPCAPTCEDVQKWSALLWIHETDLSMRVLSCRKIFYDAPESAIEFNSFMEGKCYEFLMKSKRL